MKIIKKRVWIILVMASVLIFTGCGNSNNAEEPVGADSQMTENEPDELFSIDGKVLEVNETSILINESGYENGECYLTISDDTVIYVDGEKTDISMIEAGQTIIAMYTGGIEETYPGMIKEVKEIIAEYPSATEENMSTEGIADYPAAIMVNDTIYLVEDVPMSVEIDDSAIFGYTESFTDTFPENNGETNFNPELGMPYAQVAGKIAVLYKNEWYLGTPFSNVADENTITFTGVIIDHTLESLVPVICVKTLEEEVIPYEAVYFELSDDEADWALRIDADVTITCKVGFSEGVPFGTLISITEAKTDQAAIPFTEGQIEEAGCPHLL